MRVRRTQMLAGLVLILLAGVAVLSVMVLRHGFSAREKPTRLEAWLARHARRIATPADAADLHNPYSETPAGLQEAAEHWSDHCALCHALDGSGDTYVGRNMYPPVPNLRDAATQALSDGELYYIITNGVRFTGMPAWGGDHTPEETWHLVAWIRRLSQMSPAELRALQPPGEESEGEESGHHHHHHDHEHAVKP